MKKNPTPEKVKELHQNVILSEENAHRATTAMFTAKTELSRACIETDYQLTATLKDIAYIEKRRGFAFVYIPKKAIIIHSIGLGDQITTVTKIETVVFEITHSSIRRRIENFSTIELKNVLGRTLKQVERKKAIKIIYNQLDKLSDL